MLVEFVIVTFCFPLSRQLCGIGPGRTWEDLQDVMTGESLQRLRQVYQRPEDVDMYIGQNMEMSECLDQRIIFLQLSVIFSIGKLDLNKSII